MRSGRCVSSAVPPLPFFIHSDIQIYLYEMYYYVDGFAMMVLHSVMIILRFLTGDFFVSIRNISKDKYHATPIKRAVKSVQ